MEISEITQILVEILSILLKILPFIIIYFIYHGIRKKENGINVGIDTQKNITGRGEAKSGMLRRIIIVIFVLLLLSPLIFLADENASFGDGLGAAIIIAFISAPVLLIYIFISIFSSSRRQKVLNQNSQQINNDIILSDKDTEIKQPTADISVRSNKNVQ